MFFEPGQHKAHGLPYNPFKSIVVPRPIGWISSLGRDGAVNVGPYSFFNGLSDSPPVVFFAPNGRSRALGVKDSQRNAEETGEFVVNLATWDLREQVNATSASLPWGESELKVAGLTIEPSRIVKAPRIAESPVHLECSYLRTVELPSDDPERGNFIVLGQVVGIHIDDAYVTKDGRLDVARLKPIARLGYKDYTAVETIFSMERPE
jgi:flavin reductase (DIM6/NTAB) family NADH-FMN oxidoreductase RutF